MRRLLVVVVALAAAGCGSRSTSEQVDAYVKRANQVQASAAQPFDQANKSYTAFQKGKAADVGQLVAAEAAIRHTESKLARIPAPPPARTLRAKLLRLYDLNADLAHETVLLARYLPAREQSLKAVTAANERLAKALRRAKQPAAQAAALTAYRGALGKALVSLRALDAPPVARSLHHAQIKRLSASRKLAGQLRAAVRARDARRTARLVVAFREVGTLRAGERSLQKRDLQAYEARRRAVTLALADVRRERDRLERAH